ncbi:hypothetical protein KFE25_007594 [Diacronema lutheri]|uniref:Uncharacterized protein n=1 Tax=Diacronema lutheri TaxID=2081491 RepID=A0A8J5XHM4_DIALT|nr:hypothetical protein KFE25_007594 [Diacronema lutheri]
MAAPQPEVAGDWEHGDARAELFATLRAQVEEAADLVARQHARLDWSDESFLPTLTPAAPQAAGADAERPGELTAEVRSWARIGAAGADNSGAPSLGYRPRTDVGLALYALLGAAPPSAEQMDVWLAARAHHAPADPSCQPFGAAHADSQRAVLLETPVRAGPPPPPQPPPPLPLPDRAQPWAQQHGAPALPPPAAEWPAGAFTSDLAFLERFEGVIRQGLIRARQ